MKPTGPAIDVGGIHAPRCRRAPGHVWHGCICTIIDASDRPCIACEPLKASAKFCRACKLEWIGRQAFIKAVDQERKRLRSLDRAFKELSARSKKQTRQREAMEREV